MDSTPPATTVCIPFDHYLLRRHRDAHQARGALSVHALTRDADRQSRCDHALARDVKALGALLQRGAHDQIVDFRGFDLGALQRFPNNRRGHRGRLDIIKRAPIGLADRRARGGYDNGFSHERLLVFRADATAGTVVNQHTVAVQSRYGDWPYKISRVTDDCNPPAAFRHDLGGTARSGRQRRSIPRKQARRILSARVCFSRPPYGAALQAGKVTALRRARATVRLHAAPRLSSRRRSKAHQHSLIGRG